METLYQDHLDGDLQRVREHIEAAFEVQGSLMRDVANYVCQSRGKMLRPVIVCLVAEMLGYDGPEQHDARLGAAIELFHMATLLHDDVIDKAPMRRGRETVNARWGDDVAILMADYLYATSFDYALEVLDPRVVQVLSKTTQKMTEGEMFQIEKRGDWLAVDDYLSIIQSKTAYLFSASAGLGALAAGADASAVERMFEFGLNFGLAFQITDDALDYEGQGSAWGKRVGADLREGKQTLPLIHTLSVADDRDRESLLSVLQNGRDFETVHFYVKKYNGIDASLARAGEYTRAALNALDSMPEGEALDLLRQITDGVLVRQN